MTSNKIIFLSDHERYGFHAQGQAEPSPLSARKRCTRNTLMAPDGGQRFAVDGTLL